MAMRTAAEARGKMGRDPNGTEDYFRFLLRMPPDMARKIDALAKVDYSPMNAYILRMLRDDLKVRSAEVEEALRLHYPELLEPEPEAKGRARRTG